MCGYCATTGAMLIFNVLLYKPIVTEDSKITLFDMYYNVAPFFSLKISIVGYNLFIAVMKTFIFFSVEKKFYKISQSIKLF